MILFKKSMNKILFILLSVTIAIVTSVAKTYENGPTQVVLNPSLGMDTHSEEPVPADCFVDPQTGEVEVVRTDGEGDLYVTVSEEDVPVASTVVEAEDDEGSVFVTGASGEMTVTVTTQTGGEFEGFFYL